MSIKRPDNFERERVTIAFDHGAITADATQGFYKVASGQKLLVTRASYINWTGLTGDNTNAFAGQVKQGSVVVATLFNTDTNDATPGVSLAANTFVEGTLSSTAEDLWIDEGEVLSFLADEDGDSTLPAGRLIVEGYLY